MSPSARILAFAAHILLLAAAATLPATMALADGLDRHGIGPAMLGSGGLPIDDDDAFGLSVDAALPADATTTIALSSLTGTSGGGVQVLPRPASMAVPDAVETAAPVGGWTAETPQPIPTSKVGFATNPGPPQPDERLGLAASWRPHALFGVGALLVMPRNLRSHSERWRTDELGGSGGGGLAWLRFVDDEQVPQFTLALASRPLSWLAIGVGTWVSRSTTITRTEALGAAPALPGRSETTANAPAITRSEVSEDWYLAPRIGVRIGGARAPWLLALNVQTERIQYVELNRATAATSGKPAELRQEYLFQSWTAPRGDVLLRVRLADWTLAGGLTCRTNWWPVGPILHVEPRLATSVRIDSTWRAQAGVGYSPAMASPATGRSNFVDNDAIAASGGLAWGLPTPVGRLELAFGLRLDALIRRTQRKDPSDVDPVRDEVPALVDPTTGAVVFAGDGVQSNNLGVPGFSSRGWLLALAIGARLVR